MKVGCGFMAAMATLVLLGLVSCDEGESQSERAWRQDRLAAIGSVGRLQGVQISNGWRLSKVVLGRTREAYAAFMDANDLGDEKGMLELFDSGWIYAIPSGEDQARLLDVASVGMIKVRILSGLHEGEIAWTSAECLER